MESESERAKQGEPKNLNELSNVNSIIVEVIEKGDENSKTNDKIVRRREESNENKEICDENGEKSAENRKRIDQIIINDSKSRSSVEISELVTSKSSIVNVSKHDSNNIENARKIKLIDNKEIEQKEVTTENIQSLKRNEGNDNGTGGIQVDIEMGKLSLKIKKPKEANFYKTFEHDHKHYRKYEWLYLLRGLKRFQGGKEKRRSSLKPTKRNSPNRLSKAIQKSARELIRFYIKRNVTLIFWVRLGARLCMALLYIAMAKCEHDLVATVFNQHNNLCIKHYENLEPVEDLLTFATLPIIPDFFMGALGILPLYRLYNDPFVIGYNLIIAILCIWTGTSVRARLFKCEEMVTNLITYSSNILICMGFFHFVPFFISFLMIRKGEELFLINRFLYLFKNPPEEGHWWSLPRLPPVEFINIELIDEKLKTKT